MMNQSSDDSVITYLRQQKPMLLELALLMLSIMMLALEWGNFAYYKICMPNLVDIFISIYGERI